MPCDRNEEDVLVAPPPSLEFLMEKVSGISSESPGLKHQLWNINYTNAMKRQHSSSPAARSRHSHKQLGSGLVYFQSLLSAGSCDPLSCIRTLFGENIAQCGGDTGGPWASWKRVCAGMLHTAITRVRCTWLVSDFSSLWLCYRNTEKHFLRVN